MSAAYRVLVSKRVRQQISRIDRSHQLRIRAALDLLTTEPRPPKCVVLSGFESTYRVRVGDYRILYSVHEEIRVIAVIRVGHRRDVYR